MSTLIDDHLTFMRRSGLAEATRDKRRQRLGKFDRHVGIRRATTEDVEGFMDTLRGRDGLVIADKARYQWISDLHLFYKWAIDWGHLTDDPTTRVPRPKLRRRLPRPIDTGDLVVALQMAGPMMRTWLTLMAFAGLRCIEVSRIESDDVMFGERLLRVHGKGDKERMVPMHADVERQLRAIVMPSRGRVFQRPRGGPYPAGQVSREVSSFFDGLGINATAHQLRHHFGTHAYRVSRDIRVVQELMGHTSPAVTSLYADWSREEAARTVDALSLDVPSQSLLSDWPS